MPNADLIQRLALVHEGNAAVHLRRTPEQYATSAGPHSWSQHEMLAASSMVIAASYWSMIDPQKALAAYRKSTDIYRRMGHSYWMVLALVSANSDAIIEMLSEFDETTPAGPQNIGLAMIGNQIINSNRREARAEHLNAYWRETGNVPVGRLGIPLDYYVRCAEAIRTTRGGNNRRRFFAEAANYVNRATEVIRTASHDQFHWLRLRSTVLPAEPEAVAVTMALAMVSRESFELPISETPGLDVHGQLLVRIGDDMRKAASRDSTS
jgi:hypothetical protein